MNQLSIIISITFAFLLFSALQLYAGFVGIAFYCGSIVAIAALLFAIIFRFTLPITIGAFFGAIKVWHWHWFLALLFVSPGFALIIPGVLMAIISKLTNSPNLRKESLQGGKMFFFAKGGSFSKRNEPHKEEIKPMIVINPKDRGGNT